MEITLTTFIIAILYDYKCIYSFREGQQVDIVEIFKALADETRIRMLNVLRRGELCVRDFEAVLDIQQSNASRHLNKLKSAGIIVSRKNSQWVYYRFNDRIFRRFPFLTIIIEDEIGRISVCKKDLARLEEHKLSSTSENGPRMLKSVGRANY